MEVVSQWYIALVDAKDLVARTAKAVKTSSCRCHKAIEHPPYGVLINGCRRDSLAQQQRPYRDGQRTLPKGTTTATTQGYRGSSRDNGPWIDGHLGRYHLIDHLNQANLVGIGLHTGQMLDLGTLRLSMARDSYHSPGGPWFISSSYDANITRWGRLCSTGAHGKCMDRQLQRCGM